MDKSIYREIRPSAELRPQTLPGSEPLQAPHSDLAKRRRHAVRIACENCRVKKHACDGRRPSCGRCQGRRLQCSYRASKRANVDEMRTLLDGHEQFVTRLRGSSEEDARDLLRRLRVAPDPEAFLKTIEGSPPPQSLSLMRPSDLSTARASSPPTQTAVEFELIARHRAAFLNIEPVSMFFLQRLVDITRLPTWAPSPNTTKAPAPARLARVSRSPDPGSPPSQPDGRKRVHASLPPPLENSEAPRELCDERLGKIQMEYWTSVSISNSFAATALSHYLEKDHQIMDFFDADAVIEDLVSCQPRFCTAFFVSSLMFVACQSYILVDMAAVPLVVSFFNEAEMLSLGEEMVMSVSTVAAMIIFGHATTCHGKNDLGARYFDIGQRIGEQLGLFGVAIHDPIASSLRKMPADWISRASHTAWGTFNYLTLFSSFYDRQGIRYPPLLPMPGKSGNDDEVTTAGKHTTVPRHTSPYFHVQCQLFLVAHEIAAVYRSPSPSPISSRVPVSFVESKYRKLVACMDELKEDTVRGGDCPAHVLVLHINFHTIILNLLHPFQDTSVPTRLRSFTSSDSHTKSIYEASVRQLTQLTLWYHLRDGKTVSIWANPAFLVLVGALLRNKTSADPSRRLYVLLCIRCCANLYVAYPIFLDIAQAFLAMALQHRAISGAEASALLGHVKEHGPHHASLGDVVSRVLTDQNLASTAPEKVMASAHEIAKLFEDLSLFEQFTTGEYKAEDTAGD